MHAESTTLGEIVIRTGGVIQTGPFGSQLHASDYKLVGTPLVMPINLGDNEIVEKGIARVGDWDARQLRRHALREGDIIFSRRGDVGRRSIVRAGQVGWLCGTGCLAARFGSNRATVNPEYVAHYLGSRPAQVWLQDNAVGGTMPNLNTAILSALPVRLPSRADQDAVVAALEDAQAAIEHIKYLIAKKKEIKQAAMQQLLTGRTRLQGFEGTWEYRRVTEMGDVLAGKALNVSGAGALRPYLRTKNVLDGRIELEDVLWMPMTDVEFERFRIEIGDVLLNEGQSLELVGRCSIYSSEFGTPCAMQNQLLRFRAYPATSPEFAAHLFRYCQRTGAFAAIATKTTSVAHLGSSRLSNLLLRWPADRREQAAIAEVLSDMDTEISVHEIRLDKARALKQGMMQQLLTGRTRLPVKESAE
ncbi:restriction endonuclease subunit S [Kitasatospora sp. NPDC056181]|uniref:restriction endonuclease subunit S n=1 Tax=Kitasatospora sp. NPDC056181 TaxID=3345737 RepID=UPI0035DF94B1